MYRVSSQFRDAVNARALQHISGEITLPDGTVIDLNRNGNENIFGTPSISSQIVSDSDIFNVGELYIGELCIDAVIPESAELEGAEISLTVTIDGADDEVPMGVWDISEAKRQPSGITKINAYDHLARLTAPMPDSGVPGFIQFSAALRLIEENADVEFAQTIEELAALDPEITVNEIYPFSVSPAPTCWLEVQYIAQYLGCFVIADRQGKIEFRRYPSRSSMTIDADERFNVDISSGAYFVKAFGYADKYGHVVETSQSDKGSTSSKIYLSQDNVFILDTDEEDPNSRNYYMTYYKSILDPLMEEFRNLSWYTGTADFYGDPTLDVGDMVLLTDGIVGERLVPFLICHSTWQFRAPQTLISGGAPRSGNTVTSSGGGGNVYNSTSINVTKNIVTVPLKVYCDMLLGTARSAAFGGFSAKEQTQAFITCNFNFLGTAESTATQLTVTVDGENVGAEPCISLGEAEKGTISLTLPVQVNGGDHIVRLIISDYGEIVSGTAEVSGQNIRSHEPAADLTDWEYEISVDTAAVTAYSGEAVNVEIPEKMGGAAVTKIASAAFEGSAVETVYIPDGVEVIE